MFSRCVCTLLGALALTQSSGALLDDVISVIHFGNQISKNILSTWNTIDKSLNASLGVQLFMVRQQQNQVLSQLARISYAIERLEIGIDNVNAIALMLAKNGGRRTRLELRLHEMSDLLSRVAAADLHMREYVRLQHVLERSTLQDFAEWCVSHDPGALQGLLERIHSLIVPPHKHLLGTGLMELIRENVQEEGPDVCALQMSPHQLIYDIYNTIALTEIKGYAMTQFSWMLLRIYGKGNFTQEASLTRQRYGQRASQSAQVVRDALTVAKRDIYKCDPPHHLEGETYETITQLLQGYIENEVDMNAEGTCMGGCLDYTLTRNYGCLKDKFCEKQKRCNGKIINCQFIQSSMTVCHAASRHSERRYEWIQYYNGQTFGKIDRCQQGFTWVRSWQSWVFMQCSYCMCLCDDMTDSDRYFSLWDATSDINKNKIVTGIRLVKIGMIFHLQVHDGTLKERGFVKAGSWVPIQNFGSLEMLEEGEDYHTLTYKRRAIDLDELDSPEGSVLTGVRFRVVHEHLHFEIRSTPFNYTTGRLSPKESQWISNDNTEESAIPRSKLELYKPDIPTASLIPLQVDSEDNQYLEFTHSDFTADAAQSTVPFIDIQPVLPGKGSTLISGAGIIHRGARHSGGFIAPKLITYPYVRHVRVQPLPS